MPQNGSGNYEYPPGTPGVPDQTIESEAYNTFLDDLIENDLNIARPIHRGGTGATAADTALVNLTAEKANQLVGNYDSHVFLAGSFRSDIAATAAPTADAAYAGTAIVANANSIALEAINVSTGAKYGRLKVAGVWGAWAEMTSSLTAADARFVNVTGDVMSGALTALTFNTGPAANNVLGDLTVVRDANVGVVHFGSAKTRYVQYDGAQFVFIGGALNSPAVPTDPNHLINKTYADTKLPLAGGTLTGDLTINKDSPVLILDRGVVGAAAIQGRKGGLSRWTMTFGTGAAETGSNAGSDFNIFRYNDAGTVIDNPLIISRATGLGTVVGNPTAPLGIATKQYVDASKLNPGLMKVGCLTDAGSGVGFAHGVSSVFDGGAGYVDVAYSTAFTNAAFAPPVAGVGITDVLLYCNLGLPSASSARIHCARVNGGGALVDPTNYFLFAGGTQ